MSDFCSIPVLDEIIHAISILLRKFGCLKQIFYQNRNGGKKRHCLQYLQTCLKCGHKYIGNVVLKWSSCRQQFIAPSSSSNKNTEQNGNGSKSIVTPLLHDNSSSYGVNLRRCHLKTNIYSTNKSSEHCVTSYTGFLDYTALHCGS